jgi:hypothetical protein
VRTWRSAQELQPGAHVLGVGDADVHRQREALHRREHPAGAEAAELHHGRLPLDKHSPLRLRRHLSLSLSLLLVAVCFLTEEVAWRGVAALK